MQEANEVAYYCDDCEKKERSMYRVETQMMAKFPTTSKPCFLVEVAGE